MSTSSVVTFVVEVMDVLGAGDGDAVVGLGWGPTHNAIPLRLAGCPCRDKWTQRSEMYKGSIFKPAKKAITPYIERRWRHKKLLLLILRFQYQQHSG